MLNLENFPTYSEEHLKGLLKQITPIEEFNGLLCKRDDYFNLGGVSGGKVRQCLKLIYDNLNDIKVLMNGGIITSAGLPSPQSVITSAVAKYFGLNCKIATYKYNNDKKDFNRINISLAQKLGSEIYGTKITRLSGIECLGKRLKEEFGYYTVKFGMNGKNVMETVSEQVINIPDKLKDIVIIGGSGLSALGMLMGIEKFNKDVENVNIIYLNDYFERNKKQWYDTLPSNKKYKGKLNIYKSKYEYNYLHNPENFEFDLTYESKAYQWAIDNNKLNNNTLFWVVGKRNYDLDNIEEIKWKELIEKYQKNTNYF